MMVDTLLMKLRHKSTIPILAIISFLILYLDFLSGRHIRLVYLLLLPIILAALSGHTRSAYFFALTLPFFRLAFFSPWGEVSDFSQGTVNALIRSVVMLVIVYFSERARLSYELEKKLFEKETQEHISRLESLLSICSGCKRMKKEDGSYEALEIYFKRKTGSDFSHTLCPECVKKLYPELADKILGQKS